MLRQLSIRQRILITFLLIVLTSGALQLLIAGRQLQAMTLEFYQHHLETDALLTSANLSEPFEHYLKGEGTTGLNSALNVMMREIKHDYRLLDTDYNVIGYSPSQGLAVVLTVSETPELEQANRERIGANIRPNLLGELYLHLAVGILYEGRSIGYLVLSQPMQPAYDEVRMRWLELATATLPVIILVIAASIWISRSILRPIQDLNQSALRMAEGALDTRILTVSNDEFGHLARSFNYMASQIETLMKTQRSFVSNAAHELRTPLMTLKLRAESLIDDALSPAERDAYLNEIRQEVDHMAGMVSSLLVLARVDEGRLAGHDDGKITDMLSLFHDISRHWRIAAERDGVAFQADIAPELPPVAVSANELRLMVDNLLNNALKYTPHGCITFKAGQAKGKLWLRVEDTGIGFTAEQAEHLFERFYRAVGVRGQTPGTGLGLPIVRAIVEQYGGAIQADSAGVGKGATFILSLPILQ